MRDTFICALNCSTVRVSLKIRLFADMVIKF
nr:MAG TPA: hypothetical protein [Crassvirales sp.]